MPGSQVSAVNSTTSTQYSRKYRTKSKESVVDETLFSSPIVVKEEPKFVADTKAPLIARVDLIRSEPRKPDAVRLITKDLIRSLVIPSEDPSGVSVILDAPKYAQIAKDAVVQTKQDVIRNRESLQMEKEKAALAAQKRKDDMSKRDLHRMQSQKLSDLDLEAKQKAHYLLENAFAQRLEQEDEIKHLNELCLNAKCHAIRDAQVVEKRTTDKEYKADEKRLDDMMEQDRINAIKTQEEMEELRKQTRYAGAAQVMKQIERKAEGKLQELEKKDQECQQMLRYLEKLQREDLETMDIKRIKQKKLRKEIDEINAEHQRQRQIRIDQDRMMDKKVLDFQRKKEEREAEFEKEQKRIKKEKEREIARLRDLQQQKIDVKAQQDALRAKRHYEEAEREWRRKEEDEATKKTLVNRMMQKARTEQINAKHHYMAVEAQRERCEFERVLRELQRKIEKDKMSEAHEKRIRLKYADFLRKQIIDKETIRLAERKAVFAEGVKLEEEARQRKARLEAVKKKKLIALRNAGVPDKYCREVERKIANPHQKLGS